MNRPVLFILLFSLTVAGCGPAAEYFNGKGAGAFDRHDLPEARKNFERASLLRPSDPALHNNLGYILCLQKDYDDAEAEFGKALARHPDAKLSRQIKINQAVLYGDTGATFRDPARKDWPRKGIAVLDQLLVSDPDNAEFHMRLGFACFQVSDPGRGFMELDKAVRLATPEKAGQYTADPIGGSLSILRQVEKFYASVRLFKKLAEVQKDIRELERKEKALQPSMNPH